MSSQNGRSRARGSAPGFVGVTQTAVCAMRTMRAVSRGDATRKRLSDAIVAALADLERLSDAEERYRAASWLVDHLADGISAAGKLRAQAVVALRDEENLSLAQLGERLGLSKARAADIVRDITRTAQARAPELRPVVSVSSPHRKASSLFADATRSRCGPSPAAK